ncbi:hypothetical protein Bca4012_080982 [Brassica carinata]
MGLCFSSPKTTGHGTNHPNPNPPADIPKPQPQAKGREKVCNKNKKKTKNNKIQWRHVGGNPFGKRIDFGYARDFDNRYTIGKLLGHGQFGFTYAATDNNNGDRVAVKRIDKAKMTQPIEIEDVKREVKILQALGGHENVVRKDSRYTEKDAAVVVRQMLKVAAECHLRGLVHRDMKPEVGEDSSLKATDFGLSDFIKPGMKFQDIVGSAYYVAPEVLKRRSGPESDVWSIGVITYILLCGRRPFWDKTQNGIFNEVMRKKPDFETTPWPTISDGAKDFVKKLLVKEPRARLTAAQALSHSWVREGGEASEIPIDISVLENMRQFVKFSRLKQIALKALATTIDEDELDDLRDQFDAIDIDKNGSISLEEMRQALAKDLPWKLKDARVAEILQAIDSNTDGLVDFTEFVVATLHVNQLEEHDSAKWEQRSRAAFEKFDVDRDGFITPEELRLQTGLKGSIEPLLEEADVDEDGRISIHEFRRLLRSASLKPRTVKSPPGYQLSRKM